MRITWQVAVAFVVGIAVAVFLIGQRGDGTAAIDTAAAQVDESGRPVHTISTSGTATVRVKPDSARVFFKVTKRGSTVQEVRAANVKSANDVMRQLEGLRINNMFTKTSTVEFKIIRDHHADLDVKGYEMTTAFTVRVVHKDVKKLAEAAAKVVDVALEAGANEIDQIRFFKEDDSAERRQCLQDAVKEARKNAEALAEAGGVKLRGPITISGQPQYDYWGTRNVMVQSMGPAGGSDEASSYSPGDVEIKCNASVTFEFEAG